MSMEQLINDVQEARDLLGLKRLTNPKKAGQGKLRDMLQDLKMKLALENKPQALDDEIAKEEALATAAAIQKLPEASAVVPVAQEAKPKKERGETVKDFACALLCEVVEVIDGREVGMPYETVLEHVLVKFPEAKTSVNCLRWYAGKIRVEAHGYVGLSIPSIRQRTKKVKAETVQEAQE